MSAAVAVLAGFIGVLTATQATPGVAIIGFGGILAALLSPHRSRLILTVSPLRWQGLFEACALVVLGGVTASCYSVGGYDVIRQNGLVIEQRWQDIDILGSTIPNTNWGTSFCNLSLGRDTITFGHTGREWYPCRLTPLEIPATAIQRVGYVRNPKPWNRAAVASVPGGLLVAPFLRRPPDSHVLALTFDGTNGNTEVIVFETSDKGADQLLRSLSVLSGEPLLARPQDHESVPDGVSVREVADPLEVSRVASDPLRQGLAREGLGL